MQDEMSLLRALWPLNRVHNSDDFARALQMIIDHLRARPNEFRGEIKIYEYPSGSEYNGWRVPQKWVPRQCRLLRLTGETVISSELHPLVLVPFSDPFQGRVSREELFRHLHFRRDLPDAIPYIFRKQYRHWEKGWGIALPYRLVEKLKDPEYEVIIDTDFIPGPMKILEYTSGGRREEVIGLCAHLDHPGQCNDSLTGVVSLIEVIKNLEAKFPELSYNYRLIVCPEIVGSAIYLDQNKGIAKTMLYSLCPNMLGHEAKLALCLSKSGASYLDRAMEHSLIQTAQDYVVGAFHKYPDCGDEISFDAPGIGIPTTTLSRIGELYREYHTSLDTPERIGLGRLREAISVMTHALSVLERDYIPKRTFVGNPCLANPRIDLYLEPRNVSNLYNRSSEIPGFVNIKDPSRPLDPRLFMEFFLSNLEGRASLLDMAQGFGVSFEFVKAYADRFLEKGLIQRLDLPHHRLTSSAPFESSLTAVSTEDSGVLFPHQNLEKLGR